METVYRVANITTKKGPFIVDESPLWDKYADVYRTSQYPTWQYDFSHIYDLSNTKGLRIGVSTPCLIYYWFGFSLDTLQKNFGVFEFKVRKVIKSESGLQVIFRVKDVISEKLLLTF